MDRFFRYWFPPLLWMTIIFILSSRQHVTISEEKMVDFAIFKSIHIIVYAGMYFLLFRAFNSIRDKHYTKHDRFVSALLVALIYAVTDEIHQTFVPTREGTVRDVIIDGIGIFFMYSYIQNNLAGLKNFLK